MRAKNLSLKDYFEERFFDIPIFQRKYVWKENEINEIYNDFDNSWINKDNNNIFLGSIFLLKESGWNLIIDGQQRTLFLYILFTFFKHFIENIDKNKIEIFLKNLPYDQKISYEKTLNWFEEDFKSIQIKYHNDKLIWNSQKNSFFLKNNKFSEMTNHFNYLKKKLNNIDIKDIISISNFILNKVNITLNLIDNSDSINDIFESINSKGKKLTTLDLLRNDFYKEDNNLLEKLDYILENKKNNSKKSDTEKDIENILSVFIAINKERFFSKKLIYKELKKILNEDKSKIKDLLELISFYDKFISESLNEKNYLKKWIFFISKKFKLIQFQKLFLLYIWKNKNNEYNYDFVKKTLLSMIYFVNFKNKRGNEIERLMLSENSNFVNYFLKNNEIKIKKLNFWFDGNFENFINLEEFKEDKKILYLLYFLNIKEIDNSKDWWNIVNDNDFEHVMSKSLAEKYKYNWVEEIGNIIFYNSTKNKKANNLEYKEKLHKYYNDPNGKLNIHYKGSKGDPVYMMYNYITEEKGEIWDFEIVRTRTNEILNNIKIKFIDFFSDFKYLEKKYTYIYK
ncbi:/ / hypothetical protein / 221833:223539 Forward [Candidatus Hepatoplasma crinochetorum]|uniref:GmrSD restriction endonucleases N-terminal domain-containing protein n=1 Tax=Candidatus Hepatoplasma crinochetorum TaxID=295596 RepID=A0A0G7ZMC0_9MOLU|nr:/ / hypothetical protein / 221833:223539 Forward [Candidatus Hepatoplasma crinochetorum]